MWKIAGMGVILCLCACAEGQGNPPMDADMQNADVDFLPESPEGEYAMRVDPVSWVCQGEASQWPVMYAIADVVEQDDGVVDILSRGVYGFADFTHWEVAMQSNGYFENEYYFEFPLSPGYPPAEITVSATGSAVSGSLAFTNHWLAGWHDENGVFYTECEIDFDNVGSRSYASWREHPRSSIDGQSRVWHEILEDSLAGNSLSARWQTIDTITQDDEGSFFDVKGPGFNIKNVPRRDDGFVSHTFWFGDSWLDVYGQVENDYLDLEITWELYDPITAKLLWRARDRYTGVPRFVPHIPKQPEPITGAFNAEIAEVFDSCDGELNTRRYVIESLPADNEQIQLWVGSLKPPPFAPDVAGTFEFGFERLDGWRFSSWFSEGEINSDSISFILYIDVLWPDSGELYCSTVYTVSGDKRYQSLFPQEQ